jgi:hypothetical protein
MFAVEAMFVITAEPIVVSPVVVNVLNRVMNGEGSHPFPGGVGVRGPTAPVIWEPMSGTYDDCDQRPVWTSYTLTRFARYPLCPPPKYSILPLVTPGRDVGTPLPHGVPMKPPPSGTALRTGISTPWFVALTFAAPAVGVAVTATPGEYGSVSGSGPKPVL